MVYKAFDDLDNAQKEIRKAYNLIPKITDTITQALIIDNYGVIESKISTANGINAMNKALELRESVNDTSTIYTSYAHLAEYYYRLNNVEESKKYALKSLSIPLSLTCLAPIACISNWTRTSVRSDTSSTI